MLDLTGYMIIWGGLFAHGDGSTGLMKVVFLLRPTDGCARVTCTWTVSNIPRLTKTLKQSYNDGMDNHEMVYHRYACQQPAELQSDVSTIRECGRDEP
jgi:hypothetical protein